MARGTPAASLDYDLRIAQQRSQEAYQNRERTNINPGFAGSSFRMAPTGSGPGAEMRAAKAAAAERASYLASMDQYYAGLNEQKRQFDLSLALKESELSTQSNLMAQQIKSQQDMFQDQLTFNREQLAQQQGQFQSTLGFQQEQLGLQRELGMGQLEIGRGQLDLGRFQAETQRELGFGQLDLGRYQTDISRELGLEQVGLGRYQADIQRQLGLEGYDVQRDLGMAQIGSQERMQDRQMSFQERQYGDIRRDALRAEQEEFHRSISGLTAGFGTSNLSIHQRLYGLGGGLSDAQVAADLKRDELDLEEKQTDILSGRTRRTNRDIDRESNIDRRVRTMLSTLDGKRK